MPADQTGDRYLAEGVGEVLDHGEHPNVDAARLDVAAAACVDRDPRIFQHLLAETRLLGLEPAYERPQADCAVVVRERHCPVGKPGVAREREHLRPGAGFQAARLRQPGGHRPKPEKAGRGGAVVTFRP